MKYLITTTEIYRFSSEDEATNFIEAAKKESGYVLTKHTVEYKERKQKGEVVDYWWKVTLVKSFNNEIPLAYTLTDKKNRDQFRISSKTENFINNTQFFSKH